MNREWPYRGFAYLSACGTFLISLALAASLSAQDSRTPTVSANELVRSTIDNEMSAANNGSVKFMFQSRKQSQKGVQNRIYAQANEALASLTIGQSDQPLSSQQERAEADRLQQLANHPDQLRRKQQHEKQELEHTVRILKALPAAFSYEYAGTEQGQPGLGKEGHELVRLTFKPNPAYAPPSTVEQVLAGMQGYLLIDKQARRLARIDGTLFKEVTFGWGVFGRLDKGGMFRVQQADTGDGNWAITQMTLRMTGKVLLVKTLTLVFDEVFQDFQRLPDDLPFAQAVDMLRTEQEKLTQNLHASLRIHPNSGQ